MLNDYEIDPVGTSQVWDEEIEEDKQYWLNIYSIQREFHCDSKKAQEIWVERENKKCERFRKNPAA